MQYLLSRMLHDTTVIFFKLSLKMTQCKRMMALFLSIAIAVRAFQGGQLSLTPRCCPLSIIGLRPSLVRPTTYRFLLNTLDPSTAATAFTENSPVEQVAPSVLRDAAVPMRNTPGDLHAIYLADDADYICTMPEIDFDRLFHGYSERAATRSSSADHIIRSAWIAESLWKLRRARTNGTTTGHPTLAPFLSILKMWSKVAQSLAELHHSSSSLSASTLYHSASYSLLDVMNPIVHVDSSSINIFSAKDVAIHATNLLKQQQSMDSYPSPDIHSYNCIFDMWYGICRDHPASAYEQVQDVFQLMNQNGLPPDTFSYNTFIDLVAYCGHLPNKPAWNRIAIIHKLWEEMIDCPTAQVSVRTVNSVLHAYSITIGDYMASVPQMKNVKRPAHLESEISELLDRTQQILTDMKETFAQNKNINDQPDAITYSTIMECYSRTCSYLPTSIDRVEALFAECKSSERLSPSIYTYSTILKALSKTTRYPNAPHRAEELLNEFFASSEPEVGEPSFTMDRNNVTSSLNCVANKNKDALYAAVIECWAKSQENTKAVRALHFLQQMRQRHIMPSLSTYNSAVKACAKTRGSPEQQTAALKIAFAILKTMELPTTEVSPIHTTFASLLEVVNIGLPMGTSERNTIAKLLFDKAIRAGQVNPRVIQNLQAACDADVFQSLLCNTKMFSQSDGPIDYDKIPKEWRRNVRIY